jgi:starch synthase
MDILHIATELTPYAKAGGLGDVVAGLTKHLRLLGHKVTLVLPRYPAFAQAGLMTARRLTPLAFELGGKSLEAQLYDGRLASGVELLLVDVPGLYDRAGIYGEEGRDYDDNALRFATLCRAAVALVRQRAEAKAPFQVVHAHDWQAALALYYLRQLERRPAGVLTIHNVAHQGVVPKDLVPALDITWDDFTMDGVEFYGHVNLLKAGIVSADAITTVSETYARDVLTPEHGGRLEGALGKRARDLVGIVNGVDASVWNPATDGSLAARYDVEDVTNKGRCKGALLAELGLDVTADRALAVFVGRLVYQKGADLLLAALPKLMAADLSLAVAERHPGRFAFVPAASEAHVHRFFAGSDMTIVPSRFEPGGLVQLYAQRYGSVPVAHAVGGICDTVIDCDAELETGTGFLFPGESAADLAGAAQRALVAYHGPRWRSLVRRVMRLDRGWERPARRYEQVYRSVEPKR